MKILITGIAGFIGFHTARRFKSQGHDVVGLDNFNSYYDPALKYHRAEILRAEGIDVRAIDIAGGDVPSQLGLLNSYFMDQRPEMVIHLAAMAGVRYSMDHADQYIKVNCLGTHNIVDCCERHGVETVIYASTSCVMHGNPLPWGEPEYLYPQINPYGYTKYINEAQFNISKIPNAIGLRFFTVYGPYGRPDMALFDFTKNILAGNTITLFNYGDMKRDFTYLDDIVHGIESVTQNVTPRDMYALGRGEQVELKRFVHAIEDSLGLKANYDLAPKHPADAKDTWSDTTKLQSIGYNPKTSIEEGVDNFVKWYKEHYSA
jgi:UDP-glucuronate 4-epimerase